MRIDHPVDRAKGRTNHGNKGLKQFTVHKLKVFGVYDYAYCSERTIIGIWVLRRDFMILSRSYADLASTQRLRVQMPLVRLTTFAWLL